MKAVVTVGIPASGKTTKYLDFEGVVVNRDDIREDLFGWPYKFSKAKEDKVTSVQMSLLKEASYNGIDVAVTDTNLNPSRRDHLIKLLEDLGYEVELDIIECTYETAVKRDIQRERSVGSDVIWKFFKQWNEQFGVKPVENDLCKTRAWLCDLDGTLALMNERSPYEWDKVGKDKENRLVGHILKLGKGSGIKIIFLSGRDSVCYEETRKWLDDLGYEDCELFMRSEGDTRKDFVVKKELFFNHVKDHYNIVAVFDDRPQVCRLWNLLGLPLLKVGDQSEF